MATNNLYTPLPWDSEFFEFNVAQIEPHALSPDDLNRILEELRAQNVKLAYWFANDVPESDAVATAQKGLPVDRKVTFAAEVPHHSPEIAPASPIVSCRSLAEFSNLSDLAAQSGWKSRFAIDPSFPRAKFEALYQRWIERSVSRELADDVLVIPKGQKAAGFVTVGRKADRGDIGLIAVEEEYRGQGLGARLIQEAQRHFREQGLSTSQVVTQADNAAACRLYQKCGFRVDSVMRVFHFWL